MTGLVGLIVFATIIFIIIFIAEFCEVILGLAIACGFVIALYEFFFEFLPWLGSVALGLIR